jgi:hypothetical protein
MSNAAFERVVRCSANLPATEVSTSYDTPSLKVKGKSFCRMKEAMDNVLVVMVPLGLKEVLIEAEPNKYFETPHYSGWPAMLVRLDVVNDEELANRLECAWAEKAPAKLKREPIQ